MNELGVLKLSTDEVCSWYRAGSQDVYLADLAPANRTGAISVGAAHYGKGERVDWTVAYDEVVVVVQGEFTIHPKDGESCTARSGELVFVPKGTQLTYHATEDTDLVFVAHPHWYPATERANLLHLLDGFHEVSAIGEKASKSS